VVKKATQDNVRKVRRQSIQEVEFVADTLGRSSRSKPNETSKPSFPLPGRSNRIKPRNGNRDGHMGRRPGDCGRRWSNRRVFLCLFPTPWGRFRCRPANAPARRRGETTARSRPERGAQRADGASHVSTPAPSSGGYGFPSRTTDGLITPSRSRKTARFSGPIPTSSWRPVASGARRGGAKRPLGTPPCGG